MCAETEQFLAQLNDLPERVCAALRAEAQRLGLAADCVAACVPSAAQFRLRLDPAAGVETLVGEWRDRDKRKLGEITVNADGSFFAEYDVVRPHPAKPRWFVEAVTAWGRDNTMQTEPRLLPMPE